MGDGGLGMGVWPQPPIPNPQSPIPNPQSPILFIINYSFYKYLKKITKNNGKIWKILPSITFGRIQR